ncbi:MAG: hypothetical protein ACHBN1_23260 [Heteroscytonema crispum UTEX LB 1556]
MSLSALQQFFLPPVIASAAVFSAMTIPLAVLGSEQVVIKIQEEPIFHGKLRDVATPYVVLATAISLGAGISATAIFGWRHSSRKSTEIRQQLSSLEEHLEQKEELLKELQLSESRLQITGLNAFLNDEVPFEQAVASKAISATVSQPVVAQTPAPVYEPPVNRALSAPASAVRQAPNRIASAATAVNAASAFASAQTFLGYAQTNTNSQKQTTPSEVNQKAIVPSEFEELQNQLKEMMLQMQAMQNNLRLMPQATSPQATASDKFKIHYEAPNTDEVRFL